MGSEAPILKYSWLKPEEAVEQAKLGIGGGASRVCLVASGRGPSNRDVERVATMTDQLKAEHPEVEVCACLGLLKDGQADRLREAGVDAEVEQGRASLAAAGRTGRAVRNDGLQFVLARSWAALCDSEGRDPLELADRSAERAAADEAECGACAERWRGRDV